MNERPHKQPDSKKRTEINTNRRKPYRSRGSRRQRLGAGAGKCHSAYIGGSDRQLYTTPNLLACIINS
jgi:hypothetical protein